MVQNRIELCLRHYMSRKEAVNTLFIQDKIEPRFTALVWQKLEEENQEFFQAYHLKLMVKEQIMEFNRLLAEQVKMTHESPRTIPSLPMNNGYHIHGCSQFTRSAVLSCMQTTDDISAQSRKIDVARNTLLAQSSNMGMRRTMDGKIIKAEPNYANNSHFTFGAHSSFLESRSALGDPSFPSFTSVQSNSQLLNRPLPDAETTSFGFLEEIPQNFGLSDLSTDFNSSDILESYSRPPFLATDTGNFLHPNDRGQHQGQTAGITFIVFNFVINAICLSETAILPW
ncbi:uncharacterized protein LOC132604640 isoform X3 [Lycium barbarum]|uniref:uncharacterized protein LOC132604640 isoform X3 n=1 Tax=Lycium barbarum TaxID=112863 RepID=UPI00293E7309|nr:uncharacterized protein LOC132604640 isoform X3 [Lycium barbarum]